MRASADSEGVTSHARIIGLLAADVGSVPDNRTLFDHLVGAAEQRQRNGDAERLGGLEVGRCGSARGLANWAAGAGLGGSWQFSRMKRFERVDGLDGLRSPVPFRSE